MVDPVLARQIDTYAEWVRSFRASRQAPPLGPPVPDDPLSPLGRELALLSDMLTRRDTEMMWLLDVIATIGHGVRLEDVLERIYAGFRGIIPFDRLGCAMLKDDGHLVQSYWCHSELGTDVRIQLGYTQKMAGSSLEAVLATGQPRILNDLVAYLETRPDSDATRRIVAEGGRSSLTCPLIVDGVPLGFLFFTSATAHSYTPAHESLYRQIAAHVSLVLQKSCTIEALLKQNEQLIERSHALQVVATTDPLTGLLNRRAMDAVLVRAAQPSEQDGPNCGILICDLDHFKSINDTYGHGVGDQVLRAVGAAFQAQSRQSDRVGRVGGEEFLVLATACRGEGELAHLAERLRLAAAGLRFAQPMQTAVTVSVGGAMVTPQRPVAEAVRAADAALYAAKNSGRNCIRMAPPAIAGGDVIAAGGDIGLDACG